MPKIIVRDLKKDIKFTFKGKRMYIDAGNILITLYRDQVAELARICDIFLMETDESLQEAAENEKPHQGGS